VKTGHRLEVSTTDLLVESRVSVWPMERRPDVVAALRASSVWIEPDFGIAVGVATGTLEAVFAYGGGAWDHAPLAVLVEEAGGRFCDPEGGRRLDLQGAFFSNGRFPAMQRFTG
jgi:histidinol-phosphatase